MKITHRQLKQLIKEETRRLNEAGPKPDLDKFDAARQKIVDASLSLSKVTKETPHQGLTYIANIINQIADISMGVYAGSTSIDEMKDKIVKYVNSIKD